MFYLLTLLKSDCYGADPFYLKLWVKVLERNRQFLLVAPQL